MAASNKNSEASDDYANVVAHVGIKHRIIVCKHAIQWILQRKDGQRCGRTRWKAFSYHRSIGPLIKACRTLERLSDAQSAELENDLRSAKVPLLQSYNLPSCTWQDHLRKRARDTVNKHVGLD